MIYRACPDLTPPDEEDVDTDEMVETAASIERGERHLRMLAEFGEIAMKLARALGEQAEARIETAKKDGGSLAPGEDPIAAFNKIGQTLRRTIALEAKLASDVNTRRAGLTAARSSRRETQDGAHQAAMDKAIDKALRDAFWEVYTDPDGDELDEVLSEAENLRSEYDEFRDYLDRPVGKTVAKLCAILRLDPTSCVQDGETWMVRRPPHEYETTRSPKTGKPDWRVKKTVLPPLHGEGQTPTGPP